MVSIAGIDSAATWVSASVVCPAMGIIPDHLLAPLDFSHAIPHFIALLEQ
jgi:hypothetical protein